MSTANRTALYALYCAVVVALCWTPLQALITHSQRDNTASHVVLIPLVSAFLLVVNRHRVFRAVDTSWSIGAPMVAVGLILLAVTRARLPQPQESLTMAIAPMVFLWMAGFVWLFGAAAARAGLFPLLFLAFTMPFPDPVLQAANQLLKDGSTETVAWIFQLTNTPHFRQGYIFRLPYVAIEIADECSGIRSTIALFLTGLLAGYMFLDRPLTRTALLLVVVPITILKNAIRIATLSLLSVHVDPSYLEGQLHHEGGVVFFAISLGLLFPFLILLARWEQHRRPPSGGLPISARPEAAAS